MAKNNFYEELRMAAMFGQNEKLRELVATGADPNQNGSYGPILACATWYNNAETTRVLLELGAKPDLGKGEALKNAVASPNQNESSPEVIRLLAEKGADLNRVHHLQSELPQATPLMIAIYFGYVRSAQKLIELGADVNFVSDKGVSAFSLAAEDNRKKIGQLLLDHGCLPDKKKKNQLQFLKGLKQPEKKTDNFMEEIFWLMPSASASPHFSGDPDLKKILADPRLPLCPHPPVHLLTLDLKQISSLPAEIRRIGRIAVPFYFCSDCNGEPDALDFRIGRGGKLTLLTDIRGKMNHCSAEAAGGSVKKSFLKMLNKEPEKRCGIRIGGEPSWLQYPAWPGCPDCGTAGFFIGQVSQALVPPGYGGPDNVIYLFACGDCRTEMIVRQMT